MTEKEARRVCYLHLTEVADRASYEGVYDVPEAKRPELQKRLEELLCYEFDVRLCAEHALCADRALGIPLKSFKAERASKRRHAPDYRAVAGELWGCHRLIRRRKHARSK